MRLIILYESVISCISFYQSMLIDLFARSVCSIADDKFWE